VFPRPEVLDDAQLHARGKLLLRVLGDELFLGGEPLLELLVVADGTTQAHVEVGVGVDQTRKHRAPSGVDHLGEAVAGPFGPTRLH